MRTLLFLTAGALSSSQVRFSGVSRYAAERGWMLQAFEHVGQDTPIEDLVKFWQPVGAVLEYGENLPRNAVERFGSVPVVSLDRDPDWGGICLCQDSYEAGRMIARELLSTGSRAAFGYVGFTERKHWDVERRQGFVDTLEMHGRTCSLFDSAACPRKERLSRLGDWLAALPRPCAVMAATDTMSAIVVGVAAQRGLAIPDDLSLAGVDNALHIC